MNVSRGEHESDAKVWPAFTDVLMTVCLILVFYLFTQVVVSGQTIAGMAEVKRRQAALRRAVVQTIPPAMLRNVSIIDDGSLQRFTFADWILFDSASAELKPSGMHVLAALGKVFYRQAGLFSRIQIEGHTDDHPLRVGARFPSNWELSSARATSVVRFFEDRSRLDPKLMSATGFSEYHPVDPGAREEAKAHNRRIEVVLVYSVADVKETLARQTPLDTARGKEPASNR